MTPTVATVGVRVGHSAAAGSSTAHLNSKKRIRAAVPRGWTVADKAGTGSFYGIANGIGLVWPAPSADPVLIAIMSNRAGRNATAGNTLVAEATRYLIAAIRHLSV